MAFSVTATRKFGKLEHDISRYFFGKILVAFGGFISIPLLTRGLGIERYGQYSYWYLLTMLMPQIFGGWLVQSTLRYHQTYKSSDEYAHYWTAAQTATWWASIVTGVTTFIVMYFTAKGHWVEPLFGALLAATMLKFNTSFAVAQAEMRASLAAWADVARTTLPALLFVSLLAIARLSTANTLAAMVVAMLLANLIFTQGLRDVAVASRIFVKAVFWKLFWYGLPMGIWFAFAMGQNFIGRSVLLHMSTPTQQGVYAAYLDFAIKVSTVMFMPVTYALHGMVMSLSADAAYSRIRSAIRRAYVYQLLLGVVYLTAIALAHHVISRLLFKQNIHSAGAENAFLLVFITIAVSMGQVSLIAHKGLEIAERTSLMAVLMGIASVLNIGLSLILVPHFGALGAAWGLFASTALYMAVTHIISSRYLHSCGEPSGSH